MTGLDELERLLKAATPVNFPPGYGIKHDTLNHVAEDVDTEDAALIVALVNSAQDLIDRVRVAESERRTTMEVLSSVLERCPHTCQFCQESPAL